MTGGVEVEWRAIQCSVCLFVCFVLISVQFCTRCKRQIHVPFPERCIYNVSLIRKLLSEARPQPLSVQYRSTIDKYLLGLVLVKSGER